MSDDLYFCPTSGEVESLTHGGFDTCCDRPTLHRSLDPLAGHPRTCNGGNPDWRTHHDHEVILVRDGDRLRCPECGREEAL